MKVSCHLTLADCFRAPDILHRARACRDAGWSVAWLTRDEQPFHAPDTDLASWPELVGYRPDLVILDNLYLDDPHGQVITHLQREYPAVVTRRVLELLLAQLADAGAREVILVCEQEGVSDAWRAHLARLDIQLLKSDSDRCRWWRLRDAYGDAYDLPEGRLRFVGEHRRKLEVLFRTPAAEALLALVSEYVSVTHEYDNPEDPAGVNRRWDRIDRIVQALEAGGPGRRILREGLLDDLAALYDLVEAVRPPAAAPGRVN